MKKFVLILSVVFVCTVLFCAPVYAIHKAPVPPSAPCGPWLVLGFILALGAFSTIMSISWKHA